MSGSLDPACRDRSFSVRAAWASTLSVALVLVIAHLHVRGLPASARTPLVLLDHLFNLALVGLALCGMWAVGRRMLRLLGCTEIERGPRTLMALGLGLGAVGYGVFTLGVAGLFQPFALAAVVISLVGAAALELRALVPRLPATVRDTRSGLAELGGHRRFLLVVGCLGFPVALALGLAPATDYDGLVYHLAAPSRFLSVGRIVPLPDILQASFPSTAEMIYSLGLAVGSDIFGRLVNLVLWGMLAAGTYWTGRRYLGRETGFVAALTFLTAPGAYLASSTCVEMVWGLLVLAGVLAFSRYLEEGHIRWVILMGVFSGLALGTKALAIGLALALGLGLAVPAIQCRAGSRETVRPLAILAATVVAVASPWYLKNWAWLGSPVYPLFSDADEWARYYLTTAGSSKNPLELLTLPLAIFFPQDPWTFSVPMPSYFFISYLFLALPVVALARRDDKVGYLLLFAVALFAVWATGYQLLRFLYPAYPLFSLLVAHGLVQGRWRGRRVPERWTRLLLALFLGLSLALQTVLLVTASPMGVLVGTESAADFLRRSKESPALRATEWANEQLQAGSRLFMVGNGQTYYLRHDAAPDSVLANMEKLFSEAHSPENALQLLGEKGFSHVFLSEGDLRWYLAHRDPDGRLRRRLQLLGDLLRDRATLLYEDEVVKIYALEPAYGEVSTEYR